MTESAPQKLSLSELNGLPPSGAVEFFLHCCHCRAWAEAMAAGRPYGGIEQLLSAADRHWAGADEIMILEAFAAHPRIGDRRALRQKFTPAAKEQGQVAQASDRVIDALADGNEAYYRRHGFIFIVCASGKSAEQMLELLRARLGNDRRRELQNGAAEQGKITALRLRQWLDTERN